MVAEGYGASKSTGGTKPWGRDQYAGQGSELPDNEGLYF